MRYEIRLALRLLLMAAFASVGFAVLFTALGHTKPLHQSTFLDVFVVAFGMIGGGATTIVAFVMFFDWVERNKRVGR